VKEESVRAGQKDVILEGPVIVGFAAGGRGYKLRNVSASEWPSADNKKMRTLILSQVTEFCQ
jgi:hypothetical protein